jgi:hypothetical protein
MLADVLSSVCAEAFQTADDDGAGEAGVVVEADGGLRGECEMAALCLD